ncbi:MAG: hypothetical protein WC683_15045 [bacterium]
MSSIIALDGTVLDPARIHRAYADGRWYAANIRAKHLEQAIRTLTSLRLDAYQEMADREREMFGGGSP